jgi:hypothetical protein
MMGVIDQTASGKTRVKFDLIVNGKIVGIPEPLTIVKISIETIRTTAAIERKGMVIEVTVRMGNGDLILMPIKDL